MSEDAEINFISKCSAVVVDVAGTTTSIKYVKETLFPFAEKNCDKYLKDNFEKEEVKKALKLLKDDIPDVTAAITAFKELSAISSENEGLKLIQGFIYKDGYVADKLKAHVYSDVPSALDTWAKSMKVAIYSTGSAESQQLLFSHTTEGDLSAHIARYFDQTNIGAKTEKDSYEKIAKELEVKPEQVVFISDDIKELKAAKEAKLFTVLVKREGNDDVPEDEAKEHCVVGTFADLVGTGKRKCPVDEATEIKEPPTKVAKTDECSKPKATSEEQTVTEKTEDIEKMEVDSTTESKKEEASTKQDEKMLSQPEEAKEDVKMDTTNETKEAAKAAETTPKEDNDKEAEITSTNEEEIKKPVDEKSKSQNEEATGTEDTAKEPTVADSTDAVVTPTTTTEETVADKPTEEPKAAVEEEMAVDTNSDKEKTVETKGETEKTDITVVKDKDAEKDVTEEKVTDQKKEKETEEISKIVEEEVPSVSNGNTTHVNSEETAAEKPAIEEAESTAGDAANGEAVKVDEKENKSELANGKTENGNENGDSVVEEVKKSEEEKSSPAEDIKVKKIEDASETAPVSVEA